MLHRAVIPGVAVATTTITAIVPGVVVQQTAQHRPTTVQLLRRAEAPAVIITLLPARIAGVAIVRLTTQEAITGGGAVPASQVINPRNLATVRHSAACSSHNQPIVLPSGPIVRQVRHLAGVATPVVAVAVVVPEVPGKI